MHMIPEKSLTRIMSSGNEIRRMYDKRVKTPDGYVKQGKVPSRHEKKESGL